MGSLLNQKETDWDSLINEICQTMGQLTGNVLSEKQRPMVDSRMKRRLMDLKLKTPGEYKTYWMAHREDENQKLIGLLTTHFTSFFREFGQFEWLASELPAIVENAKKEGRSTIKIWSSACSKGQEVWSLCMWLQQHMPKIAPSVSWSVYGSDIDSESVKSAENAVYHKRELETVPRHLLEGNWVKGKGDIADWYKVNNGLRSKARFMTQNLLDLKMPASEKFDVIFCRNVLIYFDRLNQEKVAKSLMKYLTPNGALITGVSESLSSYGLQLRSVAPSIYKLSSAEVIPFPERTQRSQELTMPKPLTVLCVDDSSTILTIMKKILKEPEFKIVGTASNGLEAKEKFNTLKPDVVTLDIHMPEMDGPTFLRQSGIARNTAVVMVSSVDRGDSLVGELFSLGVCDFVEKPSLNNIDQIGEEISQKLKMGWLAKNKKIDVQYSTTTSSLRKRPSGHIVINCGQNDSPDVLSVIKSQKWENDQISVYFNGSSKEAGSLKDNLTPYLRGAGKVQYFFMKENLPETSLPVIWLHFQNGAQDWLRQLKNPNHFIVMDEKNAASDLKALADDLSPATSFSYLVDKLLSGK